MEVREFDTLAGFESLRADWNAAFAADRHASAFMSWEWLRGWFEVAPHPWTVIAAREHAFGPWLGFLPVSWRGSRLPLRVDHLLEMHMAGEPAADYTGFACVPSFEDRCVAAIADHVAHCMPWDKMRFEEVRDPRMALFIARMPGACEVIKHQGTPCPRMPLPETWEGFLAGLSSASRQSLRRRMKAAEREFRVTCCDGTDESRIDAIIRMAIDRTREQPDPHTWRLHGPLHRCAGNGSLRLVMLWKGEQPIAGVASLIDLKNSEYGVWTTAFDERISEFSPGRVAVALAIREAIEMQMGTFDFMRGEEPYKLQFGGQSAHNRTYMLHRPTMRASLRRGLASVRESLRI